MEGLLALEEGGGEVGVVEIPECLRLRVFVSNPHHGRAWGGGEVTSWPTLLYTWVSTV